MPGKPKWLYYSGTDSWEHCENCAFDRVCPLDRHRDYERKRDDDALISYRNLEIDELELANLYTAHNETPS